VKVLVVEDEAAVSDFLRQALEENGYTVTVADRAEKGLVEAEKTQPNLVVLDAMMPGMDGFEFLKRLRTKTDTPVLMLTALAGVDDRVKGLDAGADDYLAKPFRLEELLARVRALLRRSKADSTSVSCADLHIDLITRRVTRGGRQVFLSGTEFSLLELLARHLDEPVSKAMMLERVWDDGERDANLVEVYISYLRSKLERGGLPRLVQTVRGKGYRLSDHAEEPSEA
jgi:DNA-binding response OmpR family regulator